MQVKPREAPSGEGSPVMIKFVERVRRWRWTLGLGVASVVALALAPWPVLLLPELPTGGLDGVFAGCVSALCARAAMWLAAFAWWVRPTGKDF